MKRLLIYLATFVFTLGMSGTGMASPTYWEGNYGTMTDNTNVDDVYDVKPIGFVFNLFGTAYTEVAIGSNGLLAFGGNDSDWCDYDHQWNWANTGGPGAVHVIAPLWTDWDPSSSGNIYYNTLGTPGNQRFIITYEQIEHYDQVTSDTFQVTLLENGMIAFGYCDLAFTEKDDWGERALVGVSNGAGNITSLGEGLGFDEGTLDNQNRWLVYDSTEYRMSTSNPVPVPGAVWLLGSGVIGLLGLKRKLVG